MTVRSLYIAAIALMSFFFAEPSRADWRSEYIMDPPQHPGERSAEFEYWTIVGSHKTYESAMDQVDRIRSAHPDLDAEVYPPFLDSQWYSVMLAAGTTRSKAETAACLARERGIAPDAYVWTFSQPFIEPTCEVQKADTTTPPTPDMGRRDRVLACYQQGAHTIRAMYVCSGTAILPTTLDRCIKDGICYLPLDGLQLAQFVADKGGTLEDLLTLDPLSGTQGQLALENHGLPEAESLIACRENHPHDAAGFKTCAIEQALPAVPAEIANCEESARSGAGVDREAFVRCVLEDNADLRERAECLLGRDARDIDDCFGGTAFDQAWTQASECTAGAANSREELLCVTGQPGVTDQLPPAAVQPGACLILAGKDPERALDCVENRPELPKMGEVVDFMRCVQSRNDASILASCGALVGIPIEGMGQCLAANEDSPDDWAVACFGGLLPPKVDCFVRYHQDDDALLTCVANGNPDLERAVTIARCVSSGLDPADIIANCTQDYLDDQTRETLACLSSADGDPTGIAACAAARFVGKEEARLLRCAASSQSYAGFGLCALGPEIKEEWIIAAECAVNSVGNPVAFAGCTAGRLAVNEFDKCLSHGIGTQSGCFGPNNTIVQFYAEIADFIGNGPGPNNEIVKGIRTVKAEAESISHRLQALKEDPIGAGKRCVRTLDRCVGLPPTNIKIRGPKLDELARMDNPPVFAMGIETDYESPENLQDIHYLRCGQPSGRFWTIVDSHTSESAAQDVVASIRDAHSAEAEVWKPASGNYYWVVMAACVSEEEAEGIEKYAEERGIASDARVIVYF